MPFTLYFYSSFERSLKSLDPSQKTIVQRIVRALQAYLHAGADLSAAQKVEAGFFYKQLCKPYYEAGVEGKMRIIMERDKADCYLVLAGNHEDIKRFLMRN